MNKFFITLFFLTMGTVAMAQPCVPNTNSMQFDGSSSYVNFPYHSSLELTQAITISAWIKPYVFAATSAQNSIVCKHGWSGGERGFVLRCGGQGELNFNIAGVNTSGINIGWVPVNSTVNVLNLNTWQHVAGTFDGDSLKLFLNGNQIASAAFDGTIDTLSLYRLKIGKLSDSTQAAGRFFNGLIDEVKIFDHALTSAEITAGMNVQVNAASQSGLVAYWRLNEGSGTVLNDQASNLINGAVFNGIYSTDVPFSTSAPQAIIIPNTDSTFCSSLNYSLYGNSQAGLTYLWSNGATTSSIFPLTSGSYFVTATNAAGCSSTSDTVNLSILPSPGTPSVSMAAGVLQSTATGTIQWYLNGNPITGANSANYTPTSNGTYTVSSQGANGCVSNSAPFVLSNLGLGNLQVNQNSLYIVANGNVTLINPTAELLCFEVYDLAGRLILENSMMPGNMFSIPSDQLPSLLAVKFRNRISESIMVKIPVLR